MVITCKECMERLRPDDPRVPVGRYHHSGCDYFCNKLSYYREFEETQDGPFAHVEWSTKEWDVINQLRAKVIYIQNKLNQKYDKKKEELYEVSSE